MKVILFIILLLSFAFAQTGTCGDSAAACSYTFHSGNGSLIINGTGAMTNYNGSDQPWNSYKNSIKNITIENGITSIGNKAFANYTLLTNVIIPNSVNTIGASAFEGCTALKYVKYEGTNQPTTCNNTAFNGVNVTIEVLDKYTNSHFCGKAISGKCGENCQYEYSNEN